MKKLVILPILFISLLLMGCGSGESQDKPGAADRKADTADKKQSALNKGDFANRDDPGVPIEVTTITRGDISSYLLYNSTIETEQMADVYSRIPGLVEKIYVEEGDRVRKNQPLLQIEQDEYALSEEKARLEYDKKKSEFKRFETLKEKNLVSEEEFENARLALRQAELQWKQAKLNLDYTTVRSPINGVIGERLVREGDRIQTSTRLFLVSNLAEKVAKVYVPQDELPNCYLNQKAEISSDVLPDEKFAGWVKRISPIVDPTSGTFKVTVGIQDSQNRLRPGQFVGVKLIVDEHENVPLIPKSALIYENERAYFFIVASDTVRRLELQKGFEDGEKVEARNVIPDSSLVVVVGQSGLKEGNKVNIIDRRYYPWQPRPSKKLSARQKINKHNRSSVN